MCPRSVAFADFARLLVNQLLSTSRFNDGRSRSSMEACAERTGVVAYPNRTFVALMAWMVVLGLIMTGCGSPQVGTTTGAAASGASTDAAAVSQPAGTSG